MIRDIKTQTLIDTFENKFSETNYKKFVREFFNLTSDDFIGKTVDEQNNFHIKNYTHVANYNIDMKTRVAIFTVCLKRGEYLERARTTQRNYVAQLLRNSSKYDTAIVAFHAENEPKWRLSFVKLDYDFVAGKEKEYLTPAKRYSYLVGEKEPCHTAQERLLPIFRQEDFKPSIQKIEEAFSVEQVTIDFFNEYCKKYEELYKYLDQNQNFKEEAIRCDFSTEQFTKKLLGQLSFLYFLQKKGWLGVRAIPLVLTDKQYKNAYYSHTGNKSKEIISTVFKQTGDDEYKLKTGILKSDSFTDELADVLSGCFHLDKWGDGEKQFIRHLFSTCEKTQNGDNPKNFFDDYLEPLFYEALNKKRGINSYYKRFNCRIPFLNGGLFKPLQSYNWMDMAFEIPNNFFSNKEKTGILDVFDRYNFTMCEDEPLEREVAVDPEMLGKIFENLLDAKDRKSKGAFYTPREIVHYMCSETLTNYLVTKTNIDYEEIKEFILFGDNLKVAGKKVHSSIRDNVEIIDIALKNIKVADPAVGSGAFPLGMLSEIVKLRTTLSNYIIENMYPITKGASDSQIKQMMRYRAIEHQKRNQYDLKLQTIQNSIFAVDIEASAVDIAKLRLWLSLVVDENLDPTQEEQFLGNCKQTDPRPLPNLDYNIMCGNSLVDEFEGIKLFDERLLNKKDYNTTLVETTTQITYLGGFQKIIDDTLEDLFMKQEALFGENDNERKESLIKGIEDDINIIITTKLNGEDNSEGLTKYKECIKQKTKPFFLWKLYFGKIFKGNGGFDAVIGNPPYVQLQKFSGSSLQETYKNSNYKTYDSKGDIYCLFYEKGINLLSQNGSLCYITSNKWMRAGYGKKLRNFFCDFNPKLLIDLGADIFSTATVDTNILLLQKSKNENQLSAIKATEPTANYHNISLQKVTKIENITSDAWIIGTDIETKIKAKAENNSKPLGKWDVKIKCGFKTGLNEAFIIDNVTKNDICNKDIKSAEVIRKNLRGKDVRKNSVDWNGLWIIVAKYNFHKEINNYPAIYEHLQKYEEKLKNRGQCKYSRTKIQTSNYEGQHHWLELDNNPKDDIINLYDSIPKILFPDISRKASFYFDNEQYYSQETCFAIVGENLKYLLGLLNSTFVTYIYKNFYAGGGLGDSVIRYKKAFIEKVPIAIADKDQMECITDLVDKILIAKNSDPKADTSEIEAQIDKIVYTLYGLTDEEIRIVEGM